MQEIVVIILYKLSTVREILATIDIIDSFYKSIKHNIVNKKITNKLDVKIDNAQSKICVFEFSQKKINKHKLSSSE